MPASIEAYDRMMPNGVRHFWRARIEAAEKQKEKGKVDQGNRSGVTAGKNLDGFVDMMRQLIADNGISDLEIFTKSKVDTILPGYFRATKDWDLLFVSQGKLIAAVEGKSIVGPSFGNNLNNRIEEAIGNAIDLKTALRDGAFGDSPAPFVGYFFILEECLASTKAIKVKEPHFNVRSDFDGASYAKRCDIFCRKLVTEGLYDVSALVLTEKSSWHKGEWSDFSEATSGKQFARVLAGKIAEFALERSASRK